ncbi:hypothetical protein LTR66_015645 [Elasticomyces elasticus]|nr:hypothetical protein LTR66_015645 [Elasticomyces elasticus]
MGCFLSKRQVSTETESQARLRIFPNSQPADETTQARQIGGSPVSEGDQDIPIDIRPMSGNFRTKESSLVGQLSTILFNLNTTSEFIQAQSSNNIESQTDPLISIPPKEIDKLLSQVNDFCVLLDDEGKECAVGTNTYSHVDVSKDSVDVRKSVDYLFLMIAPTILNSYYALLGPESTEHGNGKAAERTSRRSNYAHKDSTLMQLRLGIILHLTTMEFHVIEIRGFCRGVQLEADDDLDGIMSSCEQNLEKIRMRLDDLKTNLDGRESATEKC